MSLANTHTTNMPEVLGVLITSKCNIVCRHCCNDSHPLNSGAVSFDEIAHLITMAREIPSIKEIGISGGEPFLFAPLLLQVVRFATAAGFTSSVTTNGFWGNNRQGASTLLTELQQAGLRALCISTSVFHQEFVDLRKVAAAAEAALQAGLAVSINLVLTSSVSRETLRTALGELAEKVDIVAMPCLPAGRGALNVQDDEFLLGVAEPHGNCREHFKKMTVDASGKVYPCCSPGGFTPPLLMGNIADASLKSLLDASADNKLLAILESVGPQFFLPFLRAAVLVPALPETFSDQCHLCNMMLSSSAYAPTIKKVSEQLFSELVTIEMPQSLLNDGRFATLIEQTVSSGS